MFKSVLPILIALVGGLFAGALIGDTVPAIADVADVVGNSWLNALKMTIVPLLVALLVTGIAKAADLARAGRMTARAIITMVAILWLSSIMAAFVTPALLALFPIPAEAAASLRDAIGAGASETGTVPGMADFFRDLIPSNPVSAAANDAILPLIIFTLAFAFALTRVDRERAAPVRAFFEGLGDIMLKVIGWVLLLAPIGVFALAMLVGIRAGTTAFGVLAHYVLIVSAVGSVFYFGSFLIVAIGARINPLTFLKASLPAQSVALSTQSSLASLPAMVRGVRAMGVGERSADICLPVAVALFRATGPCMNLAVAIYVAQLVGIELTAQALTAGIVVAAITTMGAVSLPGAISFISSIAPIAIAMGVPVEPLALLVAIEAFPDLMRTLANVMMDMGVTSVIARREGDIEIAASAEASEA